MLRAAYWIEKSIQEMKLDPALVQTMQEAILIENLYDRLLEFNSQGFIQPALAETFYWSGNDVHFKIKKNIKTIDGDTITAEDVAFSFKRLMLLGKHTHGDLKSFLCPGHKLISIHDSCPGIRVENGELILTAEQPHKSKFLIMLLASMDFSVIPQKSVDLDSADLKIKDYRNTSGPFYVERDDSSGGFLFSANRNHYKVTNNIPQKIQFVPATHNEMISLLRSGSVDLLTTAGPIFNKDLKEEFKKSNDFSYHESLDIKNYFVKFFKKKQFNTTEEQRRSIGAKIKKMYLQTFIDDELSETSELFPSFSEGSLNEEQLFELKKIFAESKITASARKPNFAIIDAHSEKYKTFLKDYSDIKVVNYKDASKAFSLPEEESPDIVTNYTDASFNEDISLISYNINSGKFDMSREEGIQWLEEYMKIEDKAGRLKKFRQLHFEALKKAYVVPMGVGSYTAIVRKPWHFEMPKLYASNPMWLIKRD